MTAAAAIDLGAEDRDSAAGFGTGPVPLPARPDVHVVITLDTLLGLADTPPRYPDGPDPRRPRP